MKYKYKIFQGDDWHNAYAIDEEGNAKVIYDGHYMSEAREAINSHQNLEIDIIDSESYEAFDEFGDEDYYKAREIFEKEVFGDNLKNNDRSKRTIRKKIKI